MLPIWYCVSRDTQRKLALFQYENFGIVLVPPRHKFQPLKTDFKLENSEEISRLMRRRPKPHNRRQYNGNIHQT